MSAAAPPLLLDTNVAVAIIRGRPPQVRDRLRRARAEGGQALAMGATLVTANVGEFARVAGLAWEDWTAEV